MLSAVAVPTAEPEGKMKAGFGHNRNNFELVRNIVQDCPPTTQLS